MDLGEGAFELRSPEPLAPYVRCIGEWLEQWARQTPDAPELLYTAHQTINGIAAGLRNSG